MVCGYLLDGAFRRARSRRVGVQRPGMPPAVAAQDPVPATRGARDRSAALRNSFCCDCEGGETQLPTVSPSVKDLRLLATLLGEDPAQGRFAVIASSDGVGLLAAGAAIDARRQLLRVAPRHALIATPGGPARLDLLATDDPMPVARGPAPSPARRGITPLGQHRYRIDAELRDALLADPAAALRCGRVLPRADGLRLRGIRRRCLWWALGLRDGDLVRTVNGRRLSPEMALQMMVQLRHASRLTVAVERRGRRLTLEYEIGS
jgi:type II secretory pathway component PulC